MYIKIYKLWEINFHSLLVSYCYTCEKYVLVSLRGKGCIYITHPKLVIILTLKLHHLMNNCYMICARF